MDPASSELLAASALTQDQNVRVSLRGEANALTQAPGVRRLAKNPGSVGLAKLAPSGLGEEARRGGERGSACAVEDKLAADPNDVARSDRRDIDACAIDEER